MKGLSLTYGEINNFTLKYHFIVYSIKKKDGGDGIRTYE